MVTVQCSGVKSHLVHADAWPRAMAVREETLTLTFERAEGRPSNLELCRWLQDELDVKVTDLDSVGFEFGSLRVHLKFKKAGQAALHATAAERVFKYASGAPGKVYLSVAGLGLKVVRVRNLPLTVSMNDVCVMLGQYGEVHGCEMERYTRGSCFAGLQTEARLVKMTLREHAPNYLKIAGHEAYVDYEGYVRRCQICQSTKHLRSGCNSKKRTVTKQQTYAGSVAGTNKGVVRPDGTSDDVRLRLDERERRSSMVSGNEDEDEEQGGIEQNGDVAKDSEKEDGVDSSLALTFARFLEQHGDPAIPQAPKEPTVADDAASSAAGSQTTDVSSSVDGSECNTAIPRSDGDDIEADDAARESDEKEGDTQVSKLSVTLSQPRSFIDASTLGSPPPPPPSYAVSMALKSDFKIPDLPVSLLMPIEKQPDSATKKLESKLKSPSVYHNRQEGPVLRNRSRSDTKSRSPGAPSGSGKRPASTSPKERQSRSKARNSSRGSQEGEN